MARFLREHDDFCRMTENRFFRRIVLGGEAGGVIVKLPSDPKVAEDEEYKVRGLKEGAVVVVVRS